MTTTDDALAALKNHQQQLDHDGVMVGVSRQALDEVIKDYETIRAALQPQEGVMVPRELLEDWIDYSTLREDMQEEIYPDLRDRTRKALQPYINKGESK